MDKLDIYDQAIDQLDAPVEQDAAPAPDMPVEAPAPQPEPDIYDQAVQQIDADQSAATRQGILENGTRKVDPARQAEALRIARENGMPIDVVYDDIDTYRERPRPDVEKIMRDAPVAARLLADHVKGPITYTDYEPLSSMEMAMRGLGTPAAKNIPGLADPSTLTVREQIFGKGAGMLTPEEASQRQRENVAGAMARIKGTQEVQDTLMANPQPDAARPFGSQPFITDEEINRLFGGQQASDIENLQNAAIEKPTLTTAADKFDRFFGTLTSIAGSIPGGAGALYDATADATLRLAGQNPGDTSSWLTSLGEDISAAGQEMFPGDRSKDKDLSSGLTSGAASLLTFYGAGALGKALSIPGWLSSGGLGALSGASEGRQAAAQQGLTGWARDLITFSGALGGATEGLPVERFLNSFLKSGRLSIPSLAKEFLVQGTQEGVQELGQGLSTDVPAAILGDKPVPVLDNAAVNFFTSFLLGGVMGGVGHIAGSQAEQNHQRLQELGDAARRMKTMEIAPEIVEEHIAELKREGAAPEAVTAAPEAVEALFQTADAATKDANQELLQRLQEAKATGAEVSIPTEKLAALAQLPGYGEFLKDVRVLPDDMTLNELNSAKEEFLKTIDQLDEVVSTPSDTPVFTTIRDQLVKAGQSPDVATPIAKLYEAFFQTQAAQVGVAPEDLLRRYGLQITSSEVTAEQLGPQLDAIRSGTATEEAAALQNRLAAAGITRQDLAGMSNEQVAQTLAERTLAQSSGIRVYRGAPSSETTPQARDFPGVFTSTDRASAEQYGQVTEYTIPPETKLLDLNNLDQSSTAAGLIRAFLIGQGEDAPQSATDLDEAAAELHMLANYEAWPEFVKSLGYQGTKFGKDIFVYDPSILVPASGAAAAETPEERAAIDTASLDSANALSKSQSWAKGRDLKVEMQNRVLAALKALALNPAERSPEAIRYLVRVGVKDALAALAQNPNAIGWYDVKTRQALAVMSLVHPEIQTDPNARFAFTWALAVTSNGIKVGKNFELADAVYRRYKADGRMPTDIQAGQAQKAINESLDLFNDLSRDWGIDNLRQFMLTDFTVSEITGINKELKPGGEFADTVVRGAAVLGPKIGNGFFSNLYGVFDALTMDRWLVRTWGRWTGTLIEIDPAQVAGSREVLREMASKVDIAQLAKEMRDVKKKTKKGESYVKPGDRERLISALEAGWDTDAKVDELAAAIQKASQEPKFRAVMNGVAGGEGLRTKGNNLAKYLDGQKEQPSGPGERNYIREVFQGILDEIRAGDEKYAGLTMADLQAVLWYAEKRLYETAKEDTVVSDDVAGDAVSGYEDEEAPDYANAAAAQARADGVAEDKIKATLKQEADRESATGTGTANQPGAGSAQGNDAGGQGGGAQAARGFTRAEKRSFIQRQAIHRIRSNRRGDEAASWSYARSGGEDGGRPRVLKKLGVRYISEWKAGQKLRTVFKANGILTPTIYELETGSAENAARFVSAIEEARSSLGAVGEAVKVYPAEEYSAMRLFLSEDGKAGFALKPDGDIVSVFSSKKTGAGRAIMETAIAAGGTKLDCFDTILPDFYAPHGFRGTSRLPWNDEIAMADMPNWDKKAMAQFNNGEPDVVFMAYDPLYMEGYKQSNTPLFEGDNAYDEAVQAQSEAVAQVASQDTTTLNQDARGFITFNKDRDKFQITLTGKANLSTFLHESGHFFLEIMQDLVERGVASDRQRADLQILRDWMGLEPGAKKAGVGKPIGVREHEMFARGFEAYLMEGKAPSAELSGVFQRFKSWLIFVYRSLAGLNVNLTDEVRGVMDRLLASDAAIQEARAQVGWQGKPMAQADTGLTDAEYRDYVDAWTKANDAQSFEADARVMLEAARELKKVWRDEKIAMTKAAEAELAKTRGFRAWRLLEAGEGLEELGRNDLKIDPGTVPNEWKADAAGMTGEGGLHLDVVGELLGFDSGEQMLSLIAGAKAAQKQIPAKVRAQMEAKHGSMDAAALAAEASKAVHNKPTMDVMLTEFRAMARKANANVPKNIAAILAAQAKERVSGLTQRQLEPARWRRAELKAAKEVGVALGKGNAQDAFLAKRRQMVAAAMAKASLDAQDRIEKIRDYLATFQTDRRRANLGKAGDMYLDGVDQILENLELKDVPLKQLKRRPLLQEIVEQAIKDDEPINIPPEVLALGKRNYSQLKLSELEAVHDAVKNLWTLAKLKNELKTRQGKIALDKAMAEIEKTAKAFLGSARQTDHLNPTAIDKAINAMRWTRAKLVKMEFLFGWLDGKPDGGLAHQLIYQPIADARAEEYRLMKDLAARILDPIRNMPAEQRQRWDTKRQFMGMNLKGANIIAVALNLGNEQNKKKLLEGYGWNEQRLMAELNQFMTAADWNMVQKIWDGIDTLWPHIERVAKNATGLAPDKVVPSAVQTPFGEYSGGYYPIVYDPFRTQRQAEKQEAAASANGLFANNFLRPSLENGFTKKRTGYVAPILLSLDVLSQHLAETVHYVTHYEAVKQADKIRSHPTFQKLVAETMGREFWGEIRPWLQDIANNVTQRRYPEFGEKVWRNLRIGSSIAAMGFNIGTGIKQLFGVTASLDAIGPLYWAHGVQKAWLSPKAAENWRFALKNSQELEPLIRDFDREVKQVNDAYAASLGKNVRTGIAQYAFAHIGYLQLVVNVATWHGAYEQALNTNGGDHEKAVIHADSVVRKTQSAGSIKDLADVQRSGEATKMLTMFYSYFSVLYNRLEDIAKQTNGIKDIPRVMTRIAALTIPAAMLNIGYDMGYAALMGDDDDDEEDAQSIFTRIGLESLNQLLGSVPLLRNVVSFGPHGGTNIPAYSKFAEFERAATSLKDWVVEGSAPTRREWRTMADTIGTLLKLPIPAMYKLIDDALGARVQDK